MKIKALGDHVILKAMAPSAGRETKSAGGLILAPEAEGKLPTHCEVFQIGADVPAGLFQIGDKTPFPLGEKLNVPHPDVIQGLCEAKERDEKFITTRYTNISCVYA